MVSLRHLIHINTATNPLLPGVLLVTSTCLTSDLIKLFLTMFKGMAEFCKAATFSLVVRGAKPTVVVPTLFFALLSALSFSPLLLPSLM